VGSNGILECKFLPKNAHHASARKPRHDQKDKIEKVAEARSDVEQSFSVVDGRV